MKQIRLTQGKFAVVNDADYDMLNKYSWHADKNGKTWYANTKEKLSNGKYTSLSMHRVIIGLKFGDGFEIDHIDGDGLNNIQENLRLVTRAQNCQNRKAKGVFKYKGICIEANGSYRATIKFNGKQINLGTFYNIKQAAKAYNDAAIKYFGEFARLNDLS